MGVRLSFVVDVLSILKSSFKVACFFDATAAPSRRHFPGMPPFGQVSCFEYRGSSTLKYHSLPVNKRLKISNNLFGLLLFANPSKMSGKDDKREGAPPNGLPKPEKLPPSLQKIIDKADKEDNFYDELYDGRYVTSSLNLNTHFNSECPLLTSPVLLSPQSRVFDTQLTQPVYGLLSSLRRDT